MKRRSIAFWMAVAVGAVVALPFVLAAPDVVVAFVVVVWLAVAARRYQLEGRRIRRDAARNTDRRL